MRDAEKEARRWSLVKDFHGRHLKRDDNGGLVLYLLELARLLKLAWLKEAGRDE